MTFSATVVLMRGVMMTRDAAECVEESGVSPELDLQLLRSDMHDDWLLAECLRGADEDRDQGWRDYVFALVSCLEAKNV